MVVTRRNDAVTQRIAARDDRIGGVFSSRRTGAGLKGVMLAVALLVSFTMLPSCGQDSTGGSGLIEDRGSFPTLPATTQRQVLLPTEVAVGLRLLPGNDGKLPVRSRCIAPLVVPTALGIDGDVAYVMGPTLTAVNLNDCSVAWLSDRTIDGEDGGVEIGLDGPDVVRVFAPFNFDLRVDRRTGRQLSSMTAQGGRPQGFVPLRAPELTNFRVATDLEEVVGSWPDGRVAWRLAVEHPGVDPLGPVRAGDAIVLVTSSQHLVVLDPVAP